MLRRRGHAPERLGGAELARRFPAWSPQFEDGFYHPKGGWTESGKVVEHLAREARRSGVGVHPDQPVTGLVRASSAVRGVRTADGAEWLGDQVVLACGSWIAGLEPELAPSLRRSYHPVWHLRPERSERFAAERFPVFTADINNTGFYGFPRHPEHGVVKVAHHGASVEPGPGGALTVDAERTVAFRAFLEQRMPALAGSEIVYTRLCPYCDSQDQDFWIAGDPGRSGLTVAAGGSGHGFKFAPVLGAVVADAVEGAENPLLERFRWRPEVRLEHGREASRCHSEGELGYHGLLGESGSA
jgi:glycine/D-amino acid oxidase-like deaminating enzyme